MKKIAIVFVVLLSSVYAKSTCYSVQLLSKVTQNENEISTEGYPQDCKVMQIGNAVTLRCGCFGKFDQAQKRLSELHPTYNKAMLVSTYRYRFQDKNEAKNYVEQGILQPLEQQEEKKTPQVHARKQTTQTDNQVTENKATCYSVQIVSTAKSQTSLDKLFSQTYPQGCKVMEFQRSFGVRCGCYDNLSSAQTLYKRLKKEYENANLVDTYTYRFEDTYKVKRAYEKQESSIPQADQELRLILQVFLYKGDVEKAYEVAKIGVRKYPSSYYWNDKMAQIARWTNNLAESMEYLKKVYALSNDPQIESKLIDYGASNFQYEEIEPLVLKRLNRNRTEENIDLMIFVYRKIGEPAKILKILDEDYAQDPSNTMLLTKALRISLEMGNLDDAARYVKLIETKKPYSKENAALLSRYYYITRDIPKAYNVLVDTCDQQEKKQHVMKYYELKSDLGWYLQKNIAAAQASKKLMDMDEARLVDYERIAFVFKDSNPELATQAVRDGFKKYKLSYLFYSYANDAINAGKYDELRELIAEVNDEDLSFSKDALFWIIKAKVYGHYKERDKEEEALLKALALAPNSYQVKVSLLWHFMDIHDDYKLKVLLMEMEEKGDVKRSLYFPMASAYFSLRNINRASYYTQKIIYDDSPLVNTQEFKFLQAYIYQAQNNDAAFKKLMQEIIDKMKKDAKNNKHLWKNPDFLATYYRAAINLWRNEKFEKKLKKSKQYLKKQDYNELQYSYAMRIGAYEKAHKIASKIKHKELWMAFSDAMIEKRHSDIENMLDMYLMTLSRGDAITAAKDDGQIALAQSLNFDSFNQNSYNQNMYIQHMDLSKIRNDLFDAKVSYYNRDPLLQKYVKIKNQTYLDDSYYLYTGANFYKNSSLDTTKFINIQDTTTELLLGLKKVYDRGYLGLDLEYHNTLDNYFAYKLYGEYHILERLFLGMTLAQGINTTESTQLYIAGKKNMVAPRVRFKMVKSTQLDLLYESNRYYSADDIYLGRGDYGRVVLSKLLKSGYPDMTVGAFYDRGVYAEDMGPNGVIDLIQVQDFPVLPRNFYNYGLNFSYGMANSDIYTRVWRPYGEASVYYNSDIDDYTYGFNVGYGGKVFHQDHLVVGANYTESVNGTGGTIFELFLDYKFLYHLPR